MLWNQFFRIAAVFVIFMSISVGINAQTSEDDEVIKVDVALVNIPFSVSDREGRAVSGLTLNNFTLMDDGKPQKIEYLSTQDAPLNVVLLIDTSQSALEIFKKIQNAAGEFVKQLRPKDRCMVISFDSTARVETEFTSNQKRLDRIIKATVLSQKPGTLLRDSVFVTVDKEFAKVQGRKAIILITDGIDAGSKISKEALLYRLSEADSPIYSVFYESNNEPVIKVVSKDPKQPIVANANYSISQKQINKIKAERQKRNLEAADYLGKLAEQTGGRSYRKEIDNLGEAFNKIAEELRMQYLISFYPEDTNYNLANHKIKIKVDKSNVAVRLKNTVLLK